MFHTIKQLEEKNSSQELDVLLWSNRMDLVALSNVKGVTLILSVHILH